MIDLDASQTTPSEAAARDEERAWMDLALELLDPEDRESILLRQWRGLPFDEAGGALGTSADAARMRCNRALHRLARLLGRLRNGQIGEVLGDGGCD